MTEPSELTAAVVCGWATTWSMMTVGVPEAPSFIVGLLVLATVRGRYRRRWKVPTNSVDPNRP